MKIIFILVLFHLTLTYNYKKASTYSQVYCKYFNPKYKNYAKQSPFSDSANFASQCLKEGGFDFSGCSQIDEKGVIFRSNDLKNCLEKKGWKKDSFPLKNFKEGCPFFATIGNILHVMVAQIVSGNKVVYGEHSAAGRCDLLINATPLYEFYYPPN